MVFKASEFMNNPDVDEFDNLKKDDLVLLAKHLNVEFKVSMRKQTIKNLIAFPDRPQIPFRKIKVKVKNYLF